MVRSGRTRNVTLAQFKEPPGDDSERPEGDKQTAAKPAASSDQKDTRLTLKDIQRLRDQGVATERIVEKVAEQGRAFEVTAEVVEELRRRGFRPVQIDAIKASSPDPLVPGKWLTTSDEQRNRTFKEMKQVAAQSKADIEPIQSQHVTLWAAKKIQRTYLADIEKLEKFFHTKCAEPIRSGLDKRSAHIFLLKDHAEYEAWWRAMFDVFPERFNKKDNPVANTYYWEEVLKGKVFYSDDPVVISLEGSSPDWAHRHVVGGVGNMYILQLAEPRRYLFGPLQTGFINGAETAVFRGSPTVMFNTILYGMQTRSGKRQPNVEPAGPTAYGEPQGDAIGRVAANG